MKKQRVITALVLLAAAVLLLAGCAPPYRQKFWDDANAKGWTEKQKLAAFAYADRVFWARETSQGSGQYVIVYGKVPVERIREQLDTILSDYNQVLDPMNTQTRQYIDTFHLRKDFEHDEEVAEVIQNRVHAAELENDFQQAMGEAPLYGDAAELAAGYDARKIFLSKDISKAFPFQSDQIEAAKKGGTLKVIEQATLDLSRKYDHKAPDPLHPDDANEFVWKSKTEAIKLTNYKIIDVLKPDNNRGNYIEGIRVIDGKEESKPCLKIFFPPNDSMAIILVDDRREGVDPGFGVPDILERITDITSVQDIVRNGLLLDAIFADKPQHNRVVPEVKMFQIEIAPIGAPVNEWQKAPDANGFMVPFKYKNMMGDNYNVRIEFKKPVIDPDNPESVEQAHSEFADIEYIAKEYTTTGDPYHASPGAVIEYYHPKSPFGTHVQAEVLADESTKKVDFVLSDGSEVMGYINPGESKFVEDTPYAIAYNEGERRWWIEKSSGSKVYDKRKQVAPPKYNPGTYTQGTSPYSNGDIMKREKPKKQ